MRKIPTAAWLLLAVFIVIGWRQLQTNPRAWQPAAVDAVADATKPAVAGNAPATRAAPVDRPPSPDLPDSVPPETRAVIARIQRGGPFPYPQDGSIFGNYEGHLPRQPRGWYREYTVPTPGLSHRGMRRIVTGGMPPQVWYYSADHYRSFRRIDTQGTPP